jgi:hypothetical protein
MTNESSSDDSSSEQGVKLSLLSKTRQYLRQRITKIYNQVTTNYEALDEHKKKLYVENLQSFKTDIARLNGDIYAWHISEEVDDDFLDKKIVEDELYEERIHEALAILTNSEIPIGDNNVTQIQSNTFTHKLKLPDVSLPEYSNSRDQSLEKFFYAFESIVDKHKLTSYERFVYLRGQLSKSPRALVESLSTNEQSYEQAKELLMQAFGSIITQKFETINKLAGMKLNYGSDPYIYIGDMRTLISAFKTLSIDIETVIQYFLWIGLNPYPGTLVTHRHYTV